MEEMLAVGGGLFAIVLFLLLLVLSVLWIALPFAVFGLKSKLERVARESERTNELLTDLLRSQSAVAKALRPSESSPDGPGSTP